MSPLPPAAARPDSVQPRSSSSPREVEHGRYRIERLLGEGGMAVVHQAHDQVRGRPVALKRLRTDLGPKREVFAALFEREFVALAQLAHPRIVAVYDYGVDAVGPYYTMEQLDGGDLRAIAPADYRTACALARDVCSALSLVHSRRMVYRDLSPNNVRRTSDGLAKLIDFGALAAMGPSGDMVGTLPCVAPEALHQQPLDARTDLYALGATLYFTLVRRHAFPARDVHELAVLWQQPPTAPSALVPGIPRALDQLVLDLLQLDPGQRPESCAEVMERLTAIAQLPRDEQLLVQQSYLATPALVDREVQLKLVRERASLARQGNGCSLLIAGATGSGRSRLLDGAALEAKLAGMLVLRAAALGATDGEYGAVRTLTRDLLRQAPKLARECAEPQIGLLGRILPELLVGSELDSDAALTRERSEEDPQQLHRRVQPALREWLCSIARQRPLLIAIDDLERLDAPSAAMVALLAREAPHRALLVVSTRASGDSTGAHQAVLGALHILARASTTLKLSPLNGEHTEKLLGSVFGDVPGLSLIAQHVQRVSGGMPRDIMRVAQHLVSEGIVRYEAGAWSLPQRLSATDLPASMADALALRVQKLGADARALGYALANEPRFTFAVDDCAQLLDPALVQGSMSLGSPETRTLRCLDELLAAELISRSLGLFRATEGAGLVALSATLDEADKQLVHTRLAGLCEARGDQQRAAGHLFCAGQEERALSALVSHSAASLERTNASPRAFYDLLGALPDGWLQTYEQALFACERLQRPVSDRRVLLTRLAGLLAHAGAELDGMHHLHKLLGELSRDAGLDLFMALPESATPEGARAPGLDPVARIKTALGQAGARRQALPEAERGLEPGAAIKQLATTAVTALGVLAFTNDFEDWRRLPTLAPFAPLSPVVAMIQQLTEGVGMRIGGRSEEALAIYRRLLDALVGGGLGLDKSHDLHTVIRIMGAAGTLEAVMGRASSLALAERIAQEPRYESLALLIQQLYQLFQGNMREARRVQKRLELLRLESNTSHANEAHFEFSELCAHALANDLTGVRRTTDALSSRAKMHGSYRAAWLYGRGEHQRICGDHAAALTELAGALALMSPAEHVLWAPAASAQLRTLLELDRTDEACALGAAYLTRAESLGYQQNYLRIALSLALSRRGEHLEATRLAELAITDLTQRGVSGLTLACAHEARALIARQAGDEQTFREHAALHAALCPSGSRSLRTDVRGTGKPSADSQEDELDALSQFHSALEGCSTSMERAHAGLEFLGRRTGALAGVLFTHTEGGLVRAASFGDASQDHALDGWASEFYKRELTQHVTEDVEQLPVSAPEPANDSSSSAQYTPVLLAHDDERGYAFTGMAVFVVPENEPRPYPARLASELSRSVSTMDEVVAEYL